MPNKTSKLGKGEVMRAWIPKSFLDGAATFAGIGKTKNDFMLYKDDILIEVEIKLPTADCGCKCHHPLPKRKK